jgi:hypothetical protein
MLIPLQPRPDSPPVKEETPEVEMVNAPVVCPMQRRMEELTEELARSTAEYEMIRQYLYYLVG